MEFTSIGQIPDTQESSAEMTIQSGGFQEYLAEEIKKYGGVMIPVKAGLMERLLETGYKKSACIHRQSDTKI